MKKQRHDRATPKKTSSPKPAVPRTLVRGEPNADLKLGEPAYIAAIMQDEGGAFQGLQVIEGKLASIESADGYDVEIVSPAGPQLLRLPAKNVHPTRAAAEKRLLGMRLQRGRKRLLEAVGGNCSFYPDNLLPATGVVMSGNPLRAAEANVAFAAQSNAWGSEENPQKLLMLAGSIWDDLRVLMGILDTLAFANNYAKKLVGKFMIVELQSLFRCLSKLAELDIKYEPLFAKFKNDIALLETELDFRAVRDKVGAHRDADLDIESLVGLWRRISRYNVNKYLELFIEHLDQLRLIYTHEFGSYFYPAQEMPGMVGTEARESDYEPFDPPWKDDEST